MVSDCALDEDAVKETQNGQTGRRRTKREQLREKMVIDNISCCRQVKKE